jgi:AcrR family transcriptional regulator
MKMASSKARTPKAAYHHGNLRRELIRVAREEIARNGAAAVSLASLAKLADVSQPAPYRHFADREALLAEVATEGFCELNEALAGAAALGDGHSAIKAMALAYVRFGEANAELYRLMFASRLVPGAAQESDLARAADKAFDLLLQAVLISTSTPDSEFTARKIWAQVHGWVMLRIEGFVEEPLESIVERLPL